VGERAGDDAYTPAARAAVYRELGERARRALAQGDGVVVDATFGEAALRAAFLDGLGAARLRLRAIECAVPAALRERWAHARDAQSARGSDASPSVAARLAGQHTGWDELPEAAIHTVRPGAGAGRVVDEIADWLDTGRDCPMGPSRIEYDQYTIRQSIYIETEAPMAQSLTISADLLLVLRQEALSDYSVACERAAVAAEQSMAVMGHATKPLADLRRCRSTVIAGDKILTVVGDDVATVTEWHVSADDPDRDLIYSRVSLALDRVSGDLESSGPEILQAADRIRSLRAVLISLRPDG
jgi:predicted kinase